MAEQTGVQVGNVTDPVTHHTPKTDLEELVDFATGKKERHFLRQCVEAFKPQRQTAKQLLSSLEDAVSDLEGLRKSCRDAYDRMSKALETGQEARQLGEIRQEVLTKAREALNIEFDIRSNYVDQYLDAVQEEVSAEEPKLRNKRKELEETINAKLKEAGFSEDCGIPPAEGRIRNDFGNVTHSWTHPELKKLDTQKTRINERQRKLRQHGDNNVRAWTQVRDYLREAFNKTE